MTTKFAPGEFALAIHGGAGTLRRDAMKPERAEAFRPGLGRHLWATDTSKR